MEEKLSFEQALARLEEVVRVLETGDLPLEEALKLFQEGVELTRHCGSLLDAAEARIEQLLEEGSELRTAPFEPEKL